MTDVRKAVFDVYDLAHLEVSLHLRNRHHSFCQKHIRHLQQFPPTFLFIIIVIVTIIL